MKVLHESPECYIQQCNKCGAVLQYSLCDIHIKEKLYPVNGQEIMTGFDSIVCPCCQEILLATKEWFYGEFSPQKPTTT